MFQQTPSKTSSAFSVQFMCNFVFYLAFKIRATLRNCLCLPGFLLDWINNITPIGFKCKKSSTGASEKWVVVGYTGSRKMKMLVLLQTIVAFCLHWIFLVIGNEWRETTTGYAEGHVFLVYVDSLYHMVKTKQKKKDKARIRNFWVVEGPAFNLRNMKSWSRMNFCDDIIPIYF